MHGPEKVVADPIGRFFRSDNLKIKHTVDIHAYVVSGDAGLFGHIQHLLLERTLVCNDIQKGNEQMEPRIQHCAELSETLHHIGLLVGHDFGSLQQNDDQQYGQQHQNDNGSGNKCGHVTSLYSDIRGKFLKSMKS